MPEGHKVAITSLNQLETIKELGKGFYGYNLH